MIEVALITLATVLVCVGIHHEGLGLTSRLLESRPELNRLRVAFAIVSAMAAHACEIAAFAVAYTVALALPGNMLTNLHETSAADMLYFSIVTYTSLGYGDTVPVGPVRMLAGFEALTGLLLIAWTASFTYLLMNRFWSITR